MNDLIGPIHETADCPRIDTTQVLVRVMVKYLILKLLDGITRTQTFDNNYCSAPERFRVFHQLSLTLKVDHDTAKLNVSL
jgi:hypothetical protein